MYLLNNLVASPSDARDYVFQPSTTLAVPRKVDMLDWMYSVDDQLSEGSCVENALPGCLESVSLRYGEPEDLSRQFPYYVVRDMEGRIGQDGTFIRDALEAGRKYGFCLESEWAYSEDNQNVRPPDNAYLSAKTRLIGRYESVPFDADNLSNTIARIKEAIFEASLGLCAPPIVAMKLTNQFYYINGPLSNQRYLGLGSTAYQYIGNHAMQFRGFDDDMNLGSFILKNSWSTKWGDNGYVAIPYTVAADMIEVWVVRKYKNYDMTDKVLAQRQQQITQLYIALFGRCPDAEGLKYWVSQLASGRTITDIAQAMYVCDPARAYYPSDISNADIIKQFYVNVLGRQPDTEGLNYWKSKLDAGAIQGGVICQMITAIVDYAGQDAVALKSQRLFNNKVSVGLYFGVDLSYNNLNAASIYISQVTDDVASVEIVKKHCRQLTSNQGTL